MKRLALDIGGANIKAAHSESWAASWPFALWRSPRDLAAKLRDVAAAAPAFDELLVTTTAELCDCFANKRDGVLHVLDAVAAIAPADRTRVWLTRGQFVEPAEARANYLQAAASNWHALATWVARDVTPAGNALLVDVGSTTTDIIPIIHGNVAARGLTDFDRLRHHELIYSGALRTALMALGPTVPFRGEQVPVMAEYFATTADAHLLLGNVDEDADRTDTADGKPMTKPFAATRIARMVGGDMLMFNEADACELAGAFAAIQRKRIAAAIAKVAAFAKPTRVLVSGSGAFIAQAAVREAMPEMPIIPLADKLGAGNSVAACAYAMLQLSP